MIIDRQGRVQVINDEACRLLALDPGVVGRPVAELGLAPELAQVLTSTTRQRDLPHASGGRALLMSSDAVLRQGRQAATVTTLRDRTELEQLTGQLSAARGLADALHAQAHEAANRLHTVVTLVEVGRTGEALRFATEELRATERQREVVMTAIEDPVVAALVLGKAAQAAEQGVRLELDPDAHLPAGALPDKAAMTILGNLIDNALDALARTPDTDERTVTLDAQQTPDQLILTVSDTGPGLSEEGVRLAFERGWSTKPAAGPGGRGIGLALVRQTVRSLGGDIEVSRPPGATFVVRLPGQPPIDAGGDDG